MDDPSSSIHINFLSLSFFFVLSLPLLLRTRIFTFKENDLLFFILGILIVGGGGRRGKGFHDSSIRPRTIETWPAGFGTLPSIPWQALFTRIPISIFSSSSASSFPILILIDQHDTKVGAQQPSGRGSKPPSGLITVVVSIPPCRRCTGNSGSG